jgi:hypothetical protein
MVILEGKWDCSQCLKTGISGRLSNCPRCGDARNPLLDPEERTYLPEDAPTVTDESGLKQAAAGPNWNCGHCGQANPGTASVCSNCSEPRGNDDDVQGVYTYVSGVDANGATLSDSDQLDTDQVDAVLEGADKLHVLEKDPVKMPDRTLRMDALRRDGIIAQRVAAWKSGKRSTPAGLRSPRVLLAAGALLTLVLTFIVGNFIYGNYIKTHTVDLTVRSLTWERQIEVEESRTFTKEGWSVPSAGRIQSSHLAIHHYNRVFDHNEHRSRQVSERKATGSHNERYPCGATIIDHGNGFYESKTTYCNRTVTDYTIVYSTKYYDEPIYRKDPVYRTRYVYLIDRWVTDHFVRAGGEINPYWPTVPALGGKQRVGDERRQSYDVVLADEEGRTFKRQLGLAGWSHLSDGEAIQGDENRQGALRKVDWPAN